MPKHRGMADSQGNLRDRSRKQDGYLVHNSKVDDSLPFPALVTAWYPNSQTIDVIRPDRDRAVEYRGVEVYGNFFDETGTIQCPKLAVNYKTDGYSTVRDADQMNSASEKYVLPNNIQALVKKTTTGYASSEFRFLTPDSSMINNIKAGRKIVRHDDGSYYIHDEDGNMQFKHPSGLNFRIGKSTADITLETPFPEHEKNNADYGNEIFLKVEHPSGSYLMFNSDGGLNFYSSSDIDLEADGNVNLIAGTKFDITAPDTEMSGNLTVGAVIKAVGDIIADWMATAVSMLTHFHLGNLGYNTDTGLSAGGTAAPSTPPSYDDVTQTADLKGMDLKNVGSMSGTVGNHTHDIQNVQAGTSTVTSDGPN